MGLRKYLRNRICFSTQRHFPCTPRQSSEYRYSISYFLMQHLPLAVEHLNFLPCQYTHINIQNTIHKVNRSCYIADINIVKCCLLSTSSPLFILVEFIWNIVTIRIIMLYAMANKYMYTNTCANSTNSLLSPAPPLFDFRLIT